MDEIAHEQAFGDIFQVQVIGELPVKPALWVRQRVNAIEYLLHVVGGQAVAGITAEEGQPVMLVRVHRRAGGELPHAVAVQGEHDQRVFDPAHAQAVIVARVLLQGARRIARAVPDVQGVIGAEEEQHLPLRLVQFHMAELVRDRRRQHSQQCLIHEAGVDPLQEYAAVVQAGFCQRQELAGIQVGSAAGPGMRGLRYDDVVTLAGQHDRIAGVIDHQVQARVRKRVVIAFITHRQVGADDPGFQFNHVQVGDVGRHAFQRHAAAETDDQHGAGIGPGQGGQARQPFLRIVHRRSAAPGDGGFRQSVAGQVEKAVQVAHQYGRGPAHSVVVLLALHSVVRDLRVDEFIGALETETEQGYNGQRQRAGHNPFPLRLQRCGNSGGQRDADQYGQLQGMAEAQGRQDEKSGQQGPADGAGGVPGIDATGNAGSLLRLPCADTHRQRVGGADEQRGRRDDQEGVQRVAGQCAAFRQPGTDDAI